MRIRVVFDTNVYVPAALNASGHSGLWLRIAERPDRSFDLYVSEPILQETTEKLIQKFQMPPDQVTAFIDAVREIAILVEPSERIVAVDRDPDDDMVLECAVEAKAHLIVSADNHLLRLNPFRSIGIAHPRELKNIFRHDLDEAA